MNDLLTKMTKQPLFCRLGRAVDPQTVIHPYTYAMRRDGTFIFIVAPLQIDGEFLFLGEPVRLPKPEGYKGRARDEVLFNCDYLNVMKIFTDGTVNTGQDVQSLEIDSIIKASNGAIEPLRRSKLHSGALFPREEISWVFDFAQALRWVSERATPLHKRAMTWTKEVGIDQNLLGLTGGSLVGLEEEDDEDVDLLFQGSLDFLLQVRSELRQGIKDGRYRPIDQFGKIWSLRVWLDDDTQLCPFFVINPPEEAPLHACNLEVLGQVDTVELVVTDDRCNMVSPTFLRTTGKYQALIITNTINRGDFWDGQTLKIERPTAIRVIPKEGEAFDAVLASGWGQVSVVRNT